MDYITDNLAQSLIILGLLLLSIEILVLGFSTFVLFFIGVAAVITGGLISLDILDSKIVDALLTMCILSVVIAILSWKPLKAFQNRVEPSKTTNDMIGNKFILTQALVTGQQTTCSYSGIDWKVSSEDDIAIGMEVEIIDVSVGQLRVKQVN